MSFASRVARLISSGSFLASNSSLSLLHFPFSLSLSISSRVFTSLLHPITHTSTLSLFSSLSSKCCLLISGVHEALELRDDFSKASSVFRRLDIINLASVQRDAWRIKRTYGISVDEWFEVDVWGYKWLMSVLKCIGVHSLSIFILLTSNIAIVVLQGFYSGAPKNNIVNI